MSREYPVSPHEYDVQGSVVSLFSRRDENRVIGKVRAWGDFPVMPDRIGSPVCDGSTAPGVCLQFHAHGPGPGAFVGNGP